MSHTLWLSYSVQTYFASLRRIAIASHFSWRPSGVLDSKQRSVAQTTSLFRYAKVTITTSGCLKLLRRYWVCWYWRAEGSG